MKSKVTLQVSGVNLDKLYTKLSNKCVIQNMKRLDHKTLKLKLDYDDYIQNKELFKAFEVEQQKISGNKLFKLFFNKYCIFFICVPICLMLFIFSTCFVWQIKIYGVDNEIKSNIVKILNEKNVKNGSFFAHNTEVLEQSVLNEIDKIAQLSIIKRGSTIIVNASEKLTYLQTSFEPITAKNSGIVTQINIYVGTPTVKIGDFVRQGDILVLPYVADANGNRINVCPLAEIYAKAYFNNYSSVQKSQLELVKTGNVKKNFTYSIFGKKLFSSSTKNHFEYFDQVVYNEYIFKGSCLPILCTVSEQYEQVLKIVAHDLEAEKQPLIEKVKAETFSKINSDIEIVDEDMQSDIKGDLLYASYTLTCLLQIC
ncbi:MAG: sporulation protein YqfD [Clostridia bacterium]|nr:sporulation protein YqfD [Clostridia bacterium]